MIIQSRIDALMCIIVVPLEIAYYTYKIIIINMMNNRLNLYVCLSSHHQLVDHAYDVAFATLVHLSNALPMAVSTWRYMIVPHRLQERNCVPVCVIALVFVLAYTG